MGGSENEDGENDRSVLRRPSLRPGTGSSAVQCGLSLLARAPVFNAFPRIGLSALVERAEIIARSARQNFERVGNAATRITLNVKTPINLREVAVIERVTPQDIERLAAKAGLPASRFEAFHSNVRFIDGSNTLVTQDFDEIARRAKGRFVWVRGAPDAKGGIEPVQIVPVDAIRHFEYVNKDDRAAIKARYRETDPARIDALRTRVVYFELDPESVKTGKPNFFQKMYPADIKQDLRGTQALEIIGLGHGRFVLADEIIDARTLNEAELQSLARKYNVRSDTDGDLITSITLRAGDLIMSSFAAQDIAGRIKRSLPSAAAPAPVEGSLQATM